MQADVRVAHSSTAAVLERWRSNPAAGSHSYPCTVAMLRRPVSAGNHSALPSAGHGAPEITSTSLDAGVLSCNHVIAVRSSEDSATRSAFFAMAPNNATRPIAPVAAAASQRGGPDIGEPSCCAANAGSVALAVMTDITTSSTAIAAKSASGTTTLV